MNSSDPNPAGAAVSRKDAVLIVDDERPLLDVYCAALAPFFEVTTAPNASAADASLQTKTFKVVLADHLMPGESGMDFLIRARRNFPHMQRVLVTGYLKPDMLLRGVNEALLFRYLLKPVLMSELVKVVREAVKAHDQSAATAS